MGEELAFCLIIERSTEPMITGRTVGRERRWRTGHGWEACLRGLWGSVQVEDGRWIGNDVILCVLVGDDGGADGNELDHVAAPAVTLLVDVHADGPSGCV